MRKTMHVTTVEAMATKKAVKYDAIPAGFFYAAKTACGAMRDVAKVTTDIEDFKFWGDMGQGCTECKAAL